MCGIACVLNLDSNDTRVNRVVIERMRDRLSHRGPDDSGLWEGRAGSIGHRRLKVVDLSDAGHQPMVSHEGRYVFAYNGELYNDHDLRMQLGTLGVKFKSNCDTETFMQSLIAWGADAIDQVRGMYAFVFLDTLTNRVIAGRDPMGVKPLYHTVVDRGDAGRQILFASEIPALLAHPDVDRKPDPVTVSAYLSSVRTTLGERTMFAGVSTLVPGQWLEIPLDSPASSSSLNWWGTDGNMIDRSPTQSVRQTIEESVHRHLRTDVPMCALLSGGLDSAITTKIAIDSMGELNTYCAGAKVDGYSDDFAYAAMLASHLGTKHTEVVLTENGFVDRWGWMVGQLGVPLSTPNEVAIFEVASALGNQGHVVTLSGEGADELFGGYAPIMQQAAAHLKGLGDKDDVDGGLFHLRSNAWISEELKPGVLNAAWIAGADGDAHLRSFYRDSFSEISRSLPSESKLEAHLRFQRRMNLPNLLQRLDTSTMLASVEGRTPYADIEVAICAQSLGMDQKYIDGSEGNEAQTKIALRNAFKHDLPQEIVSRPKASFPLPFQHWMGSMTDRMFESQVARTFFTEQALGLVCAKPANYWHMAWPMMNLMLWGEQWFGDAGAGDTETWRGKYSSSTISG